MHCASSRSADLRRAALVVFAALLAVSPAVSQSSDPDLEKVREDITRMKGRLESVRRQARSAASDLEAADLELGIRSRELELAIEAQKRVDVERQAIEARVGELGPLLEKKKRFLGERLAALYRTGGLSYVRLLVAIDDRTDPFEAVSMLTFLVTRDARAVSDFQAQRQQLAMRTEDLANAQKRLEQVRRIVEERQRSVAAARAEKERLFAALHRQETGSEKQLAELEEKARRLERLLATLATTQAGESVALDIRTVQGALPWPVKGKIVERFGRQRNPKFDTYTTNNGIRIVTDPAAEVRAVYQGTVLFSQWFKGYGNLIILDHGHRVFSLYGNLKGPSVAVGDKISPGQTIAGARESEEMPPAHLYFEMRQDNKPEDPQKWLR